jgi:hypothetical protein
MIVFRDMVPPVIIISELMAQVIAHALEISDE